MKMGWGRVGKKILVTGGAGFIGSHIADAFLARGDRVWILDDLSTGKPENVPPGAELVEGSISDPIVSRLFEQAGGFDIVSHHAAQIDVRRSVNDPRYDARINIDQSRLYTLYAAWLMDTAGNKAARNEISGIKVVVPNMALAVIDNAMQTYGAMGVSQDTPLARMYGWIRALRFADGPDEVHRQAIARRELRRWAPQGSTGPER